MTMLKSYYQLTKPGIIYGNLITTAAGFFLASTHSVDLWLLIATLVGIGLIIGSACSFNNYIDRDIDSLMDRTAKRAIVTGEISGLSAIVFASFLGVLGFVILAVYTNSLTVLLGVIAFIDYIALYGYAKRNSVHGTIVGSIAGALPPVAGYTAVTGKIDGAAMLIFFALVFWQMPHFYAIAIYRFKDYKNAGLPVLPVKKGIGEAKKQIIAYIVAFTITVIMFSALGYTGYTFLIIMGGIALSWLVKGIRGFGTKDASKWARSMFFYSLIVNLSLAIMLSVGARLP